MLQLKAKLESAERGQMDAHSGLAQIQSPSRGATFGMLFGRIGRSPLKGGALSRIGRSESKGAPLSRGRGASLYLRGAATNEEVS